MVFGVPKFTGRKRSRSPRSLSKTAVLPALGLSEATFSRDVNPNVVDINPIPVPTGGTTKKFFPRFRANLTSGDRTKTHHEHMKPHQPCYGVYSPECRDREWELPTWIGGTDWVKHPLYHHAPPDSRTVFAQDPLGLNPPDYALSEAIAVFRSLDEATSSASLASNMLKTPFGLLSRAASASSAALSKSWSDLFRSSATAPKSPPVIAKRRKKGPRQDADRPLFKIAAKPGTPEHDEALYKQAVAMRRMTGKPFYIVDYGGGRKYVTSRPMKHGKVTHVVEATTTANVGSRTDRGNPFFGRRGLQIIEKQRKERMRRQTASKCKHYDPKCRDKEWEVPVAVGGVNLMRR